MRRLAALLAVLLLAALFAGGPAGAADRVVDLPTGRGENVMRVLLLAPAGPPRGALVLLAGGDGSLDMAADGSIRALGGNQLVRTRTAYVAAGWLVAVPLIGIDGGAFWSQMQGGVNWWSDVGNGVIKSAVFGLTVTFVSLWQGYTCKPTPEGVSQATTRTVVVSSLAVLALDFVLTALMFSV